MKVAIIGAGNMGGAIASGLAQRHCCHDCPGPVLDIHVSNPSTPALQALKDRYPAVSVTTSNTEAASGADFVVLAVKPWILPGVVEQVKSLLDYARVGVVSIVGGVDLADLETMFRKESGTDGAPRVPALFHVIPDTAIALCKSMTFIASLNAPEEMQAQVREMFEALGEVAMVEPRLMGAATALSSCGIAYVYKFIQACVSAGVQMGFYPHQALRYVNATVEGAVAMLKANGTLPQQEIDRVTTPGGMTIKGINELDHAGFSSAVIRAILKPLSK